MAGSGPAPDRGVSLAALFAAVPTVMLSDMSRLGRGRWTVSPFTLAAVPIGIGLVGNLATSTVEVKAWWWTPLTWTLTGVLVIVAVASQFVQARSAPTDHATMMETAAAELSKSVRRQWEHEAVLRRVRQPAPLRVRWSSTGLPVAAAREAVLDLPDAHGREIPLQGDAEEIVVKFRELPHRQLVVLGEPGAGKSVLALLLTLGLIEHPVEGEPVPVLLPIADWNPDTEHIEVFIARRLGDEYRGLAGSARHEQNPGQELLAERRILPVLDGLDELPADRHAAAIQSLDGYAGAGNPLVVTCRTREYAEAVATSGVVLSRAAVVEIEPLDVDQVIEFLSHPEPSRSRWERVFAHLRECPRGPLATALSTPLMVSLARVAYQRPTTDPTDLLGHRIPGLITEQLIGTYLTSVYQPGRLAAPGVRRLRNYDPLQASRWLSVLAYHLYVSTSSDLWWWRLSVEMPSAGPARVHPSATIVIISALSGVAGAGAAAIAGPGKGLITGIAVMLICAAAAGRLLWPLWPHGYPPHVPSRYRALAARRRPLLSLLIRIQMIQFLMVPGMLAGLLADDPRLGIYGGIASALALAFTPSVSMSRPRLATPRATLRANHRNAAAAALQHGLVSLLAYTLIGSLLTHDSHSLSTGLTAALLYAATAAAGSGWWTWITFRAAHLYLAARDRLPWRLWSFLEDGHRRGVFRQAGTAWQFRHLLLQHHLARRSHLDHLRTLVDRGGWDAVLRLIDFLVEGGQVEELGRLADQGNWQAAERLARLLARQGQVEQLRTRADQGDRYAAQQLAALLAEQGQAEQLRARADQGDEHAATRLANLLAEQGQAEEALTVLRAFAERGIPKATGDLVDMLTGQGRAQEALAFLRARADQGDEHAATRLANLLAGQGRVEESLALLRTLAGRGDQNSAHRLAELLAEQGRVEELRALVDREDMYALQLLAGLLDEQGRVEEAVTTLRAFADRGHWIAARQLAALLAKQGRLEELRVLAAQADVSAWLVDLLAERGEIEELRALADRKDDYAAERLAELLAAQGREEELRALTRKGGLAGARKLVDLLARQGRLEELRTRADHGDWLAALRLAESAAEQGQVKEALVELRVLADQGNEVAAMRLAELLIGQGRKEEAVAILRVLADRGIGRAILKLAELLAEQGRVEETPLLAKPFQFLETLQQSADPLAGQERLEELRTRADRGERHAVRRLVDSLARQGRLEELRTRADHGDWYAARRLADSLARREQVEEAVTILRALADKGDEDAARNLAELRSRGQSAPES